MTLAMLKSNNEPFYPELDERKERSLNHFWEIILTVVRGMR
jgi:hypothetical protein